MRNTLIYIFLMVHLSYIYVIEYSVNADKFPVYSIIAITIIVFSLTIFIGFIGEIILWQWSLLKNGSIPRVLFKLVIFPYVIFTWLFKYDYSLVARLDGAVIWIIILYILLIMQRNGLHKIFVDKKLDKKGDLGRMIPQNGINSLTDIFPLFFLFIFFIALTFIFKNSIAYVTA